MFQSIRQNAQIYVLHKGDNPYMEFGYVTGVSVPRPKYTVPATFNNQEMVVDITANINGQNVSYKNLPANVDIADSFHNTTTVVVSMSKDAINAEINNLKQKSIDVLNSVDIHKRLIDSYDKIILDLNPEFADKQKQQDEINELKQQMSDLIKSVSALIGSGNLREKQEKGD